MKKIFEEIQKKTINSMETKKPTRRTAVLSSEVARLSIGDNCFESVIADIKSKEKTSNQSTIEKLKANHKKHMASFISDEDANLIMNDKRKIAADYKEEKEDDFEEEREIPF